MKRLLVVIVVGAALWSGYWFVASQGARAGFETWFESRRAEGWQADYTALSIKGFPNRVDATFDQPVLADPDSGLAWQAPFFQILALSYKPNHVIAVWPNTQQVSTPTAKYTISSADMRASLVMEPAAKLPLQRSNLVAGAMAIEGPRGTTTLTGVQLGLGLLPGATQEYRIALNADGVAPPLPGGIALRTAGHLPRQLDALRADLSVEFDRPWDLTALEDSRPQPTRLRLKQVEAKWGELELAIAGKFDIDPSGRPTGQLMIKARNWRDILTIVDQLGWLPAGWIDTVEGTLGLVAQLAGNSQTLDLPLDFKAGQMSLGPVPLGPAPVIRLR